MLDPSRRTDLVRIATEVMAERGLEPEFPAGVLRQLSSIAGPARDADSRIRDLTALLWFSIDNDGSLDLDQLTVCELLADGAVKILVAVSDVDALVKKGSAIDEHAWINTTSVYTSARVFPMLPVRVSTDLTSLNPDQDRLAVVTDMSVAADASITHATLYRAAVRNKAKLAYDAVPAWPRSVLCRAREPLNPAARYAARGVVQTLRPNLAHACLHAVDRQAMAPSRRHDGSSIRDLVPSMSNDIASLLPAGDSRCR